MNGVENVHYSKGCINKPSAKTPTGENITTINYCVLRLVAFE